MQRVKFIIGHTKLVMFSIFNFKFSILNFQFSIFLSSEVTSRVSGDVSLSTGLSTISATYNSIFSNSGIGTYTATDASIVDITTKSGIVTVTLDPSLNVCTFTIRNNSYNFSNSMILLTLNTNGTINSRMATALQNVTSTTALIAIRTFNSNNLFTNNAPVKVYYTIYP